MPYTVHVKQIAPQLVAMQRTHTTVANLGTTMHAILAKIANAVEPRGSARGAPFAIYHNEPFTPDDVDVEMGLPLAHDARLAETADAHACQLPGGAVAYTIHEGPYGSIGAAYDAIHGWLREQGHRPQGPPREIYLVGPGQDITPAEYRTEIDVPVD